MPRITRTKTGFNIQHSTREVWGVDDPSEILERGTWKAYEDRGGYFAVVDGVLYVVPMDGNGLMDASDPIEVDFDNMGADDVAACRRIQAELSLTTSTSNQKEQ